MQRFSNMGIKRVTIHLSECLLCLLLIREIRKILEKRCPNNPTVAHRQDKFVEPNILITKLTQRYLAWGEMLR